MPRRPAVVSSRVPLRRPARRPAPPLGPDPRSHCRRGRGRSPACSAGSSPASGARQRLDRPARGGARPPPGRDRQDPGRPRPGPPPGMATVESVVAGVTLAAVSQSGNSGKPSNSPPPEVGGQSCRCSRRRGVEVLIPPRGASGDGPRRVSSLVSPGPCGSSSGPGVARLEPEWLPREWCPGGEPVHGRHRPDQPPVRGLVLGAGARPAACWASGPTCRSPACRCWPPSPRRAIRHPDRRERRADRLRPLRPGRHRRRHRHESSSGAGCGRSSPS